MPAKHSDHVLKDNHEGTNYHTGDATTHPLGAIFSKLLFLENGECVEIRRTTTCQDVERLSTRCSQKLPFSFVYTPLRHVFGENRL